MTTKAPTNILWDQVYVSNMSVLLAGHLQSLDRHTAYLAAVRHLQIPQSIGRPLDDDFAFDGLGGAWKASLRIPAHTTWIAVYGLIRSTDEDQEAYVKVRANPDGAGWSAWTSIVAVSWGSDFNYAIWVATGLMQADDSYIDDDQSPLNVPWDSDESTVELEFDVSTYCEIDALWLQTMIAASADMEV